MMTANIGIIGGTGVYNLNGIENAVSMVVETPYGAAPVKVGEIHGKKVAFLTRHGDNHSIAPGNINYRANLSALRQLGVKHLFATACSGSINPQYGVGDFVLIEQFMEFTKNRPASFFTGNNGEKIAHVDNTNPYCMSLGQYVKDAAQAKGIEMKSGSTYCCTEGPRFETAAEIRMFRTLGGDLVGHTNYPEVALAREAEMCYTAIAIVSNMAAGISDNPITGVEVKDVMKDRLGVVQDLILEAIRSLPEDRDCGCHHLLDDAYI